MSRIRCPSRFKITDEGRTYFLMDIPCHPAFYVQEGVQEVSLAKINDNEVIIKEMSKKCPRNVQEISKFVQYNFSVCLQRCVKAVSAQEMLAGIDDISDKQLRRKYLNPLLDMGLIERTLPESPRNRNQKYKLTKIGKEIVYTKG